MKFALLGEDPALRPLVRALSASSEHDVVAAIRAPELAAELVGTSPGLRLGDDPAEVLVAGEIDGAIVSGWDPDVLDAAKRLAADGTPLVFVPDARQDLAVLYELGLVRDDTGVALVPFHPRLAEPRWQNLRSRVAERPIEANDLWRIEREVAVPRLTKEAANVALLEDVLLLQALGGGFDRVTALRSGETNDGFTATTVTLAGPERPEVAWTLRSASSNGWRLAIRGNGESAEFAVDDTAASTEARVATSDVESLAAALRGDIGPAGRSWSDLVRAFEVVEAAGRSLRRRRTIDLLFEETSERNQFKSQMAAGGCAMLMFLLLASVVITVTGSLAGPDSIWRSFVPWALLLPVALFLGLQLLYFVAQPGGDDGKPSVTSESDGPSKE